MRNRILAVLLAVTMVFGAIPAQAVASETASTPVELTAEAASFSVEIPTNLPVSVDKDGNVSVAHDVVITNNSPAPVKLESMRVEPAEGWTLVPMGTDFSNKPVDTKEMALSLFGKEVAADGSVDVSGVDMVPGTGGAARAAVNVASVDYSVKCGVFRNTGAMTAAKITSVIGFEAEKVAEPEPEVLADYAVLYSDGTLAFQAGNEPKGGHGTITKSWYGGDGGWLTAKYTSGGQVPWYNSRTSIKTVKVIDKIVSLSTAYWFQNCYNLTSLDLFGFDTSNVTNMKWMFANCSNLTSLDLSDFDTSNVTNMGYMFNGCSGLTSLDVSSFSTSNVTDMSYMFYNCSGLTSLDVSSFNTSNVTNMGWMFYNCSGLISLDLSSFDVSNVTDMSCMFQNCSSLNSLDLSSFDTSNVTYMDYTFCNCSGLTTIFTTDTFDITGVVSFSYMFGFCSKLVGGNGTKYSTSHIDKTYARIDLPGQPGYFTAKA